MSPALEFQDLPEAPQYHMRGPALPKKVDPIPADLQDWMDAQTKPIVSVAFGTNYRHTTKSIRKLHRDFLDEDVDEIWSLPEKDQAALTGEAPLESFATQVATSQSGKIAAFVTHCGSNSMNEALLSGVPMVCCPGLADQPANAARLAKAGVGVIAKKNKVGMALKKLLENRASMTETSKLLAMELQSLQGATRAADLIEEIAREKYNGPPVQGPSHWPWWPLGVLAVCLPALLNWI